MPAAAEPSRIAARRILDVEDNELNMKLLNDVLEAHGYDVLSTGTG
jgi:two-component system, cell cycle response regulator DivK